MIIPSTANWVSQFYALGNTPAISLTRHLPQGADARILLLGCGDARNILYTTYVEDGLPPRRLDITCCDYDHSVLARNALLFSLLFDKDSPSQDLLWAIYYDLYLTDAGLEVIRAQAQNLLNASEDGLNSWLSSKYAMSITFCDEASLKYCRSIWEKYASFPSDGDSARLKFKANLQSSRDLISSRLGVTGKMGTIITGIRSAAPLVSVALGSNDIPGSHTNFWKEDSSSGHAAHIPNPTFAASLSDNVFLHYGTDPVLGFHLASAIADLAPNSPLRVSKASSGTKRITDAAKVQFAEWTRAFRNLKGNIVIRFAVSDALAFCHTLQQNVSNGECSANHFQRQLSAQTLCLDPASYGSSGKAPTSFNMIDSSNLIDHIGALNVLVAAGPLLENSLASTLHMEMLLKTQETRRDQFNQLLHGHAPTLSLILGVSPVEFWTNSTVVSSMDDMFLGKAQGQVAGKTQVHARLSWKPCFSNSLAGRDMATEQPQVDSDALAQTVFTTYLSMFDYENPLGLMSNLMSGSSPLSLQMKMMRGVYPHFHRGSLVALLKLVKARVRTDIPKMCQYLIKLISDDNSLMVGTTFIQELCVQLHIQGLYTEPSLRQVILAQSGIFKLWKEVPEAVAVTIVIPKPKINHLFSQNQKHAAPTLQASVAVGNQWLNLFADIQLCFGSVCGRGPRDTEEFLFDIEPDTEGFLGSSPLIASFYVPTSMLQVNEGPKRVGIRVQGSHQNLMMFKDLLGVEMIVYETGLEDQDRVFISRHLPGQSGYPVSCAVPISPSQAEMSTTPTTKSSLTLNIDARLHAIQSVTNHVDMFSEKAKSLLTENVPIELSQTSPFSINIVFGKNALVIPTYFPAPVNVSKGQGKMRVARKSCYVEVIAPLVTQPETAEPLADYMFPSTLSSNSMPVTTNLPHVNLDRLPILDLKTKKGLSWLEALLFFQFSSREKQHRNIKMSQKDKAVQRAEPKMDFKDSLVTLLCASAGLKGATQTNVCALNHPGRGGVHMLIFIHCLRLDGASASVVADAAVLPLTHDLILNEEGIYDFLSQFTDTTITINVDDAELLLWRQVIPALVERCRTWSHGPKCEYKKKGAKIPLSMEPGTKLLCSCGQGKFPTGFSFPQYSGWASAAKYMTRMAISPTFVVPYVEDIMDSVFS